jgi:DNA replication protein DnaC
MTTRRRRASSSPAEDLRERATKLKLYGVLAHWDEYGEAPWLPGLLEHEEQERQTRSLARRVRGARLGRFKDLAAFDWSWPKRIDRELLDEVFTLGFLEEAANVILIGPNGVGKTTIVKNLAHKALLEGHTARFVTASELLNDLASQESTPALTRRLRHYCRPALLVIDEVGYLSYDSRHADLLFEVVSRRNQEKSTALTTNRPFAEWGEVFPNASCVVALVDRLVHKAEIVQVQGDSYRVKDAKEREARRASSRAKLGDAAKKQGKKKTRARSRS